MKKFVIAAAMAAALTTPAMANDQKTADTSILSTQAAAGAGLLGGAGLTATTIVTLTTIVVTTFAIASASSGSGT
jgi:hypothetical protein